MFTKIGKQIPKRYIISGVSSIIIRNQIIIIIIIIIIFIAIPYRTDVIQK